MFLGNIRAVMNGLFEFIEANKLGARYVATRTVAFSQFSSDSYLSSV